MAAATAPRRTRRALFRRVLRRTLTSLALLLAAGVAAVAAALWWTLPAREASLDLPGLTAPVEIRFDPLGIPRITAANEADAAMAIGVLHARDRLFQMELMRRGATGRLAELAGPAALRVDRFTRLLGLGARAEADLAGLPADTRALLESYTAGVNAWIAARGRFAAPEFLLLGAPEPWTARDSLLWGKLMGLYLSGNWRQELERSRVAPLLSPERLLQLTPEDDGDGQAEVAADLATTGQRDATAPEGRAAAILPQGHAAAAMPEDRDAAWAGAPAGLLAALPRFPLDAPLPGSASNAWAVAAERSVTGAPLLASDPHLGFTAPVLWYLARIELPGGRFLAGATSPGVPFVVIGRNERLAWGFTTTQSDTQDVFLERPAGPDAYATPDGPRPFAVRQERIAVRGGATETLRVRETRHGPVVSDLDPPSADGMLVAVAMANLAPGDTSAAGLHALNRAGDLEAARAAAAAITSPSQNLTVAALGGAPPSGDAAVSGAAAGGGAAGGGAVVGGTAGGGAVVVGGAAIGAPPTGGVATGAAPGGPAPAAGGVAMFLTGRTPLRAAGDGSLPVPGWDGAHDWTGWVPFDALPHVVRPASGAVANANNRVQPADGAAFLGRDWPGDWRFRRIAAALAGRPRHAPADFVALQSDAVSLHARALLPLLRRLPRPAGVAGAARDLLLSWDGEMAADRPQPLIFNAWAREAGRLALLQGGLPAGTWSPSAEFLRFVLAPDGRGAGWCGPAGCDALVAQALDIAARHLADRFGPDPAAWRWGTVHVARFEHPVLRALPVLSAWSTIAVPTPGDGETISRGGFRDDFAHVHGAGLRLVADLASPDGLLAAIGTGQSGNPLSPHWSDLNPGWAAGQPVTLGREAPEAGRLRLLPAAGR